MAGFLVMFFLGYAIWIFATEDFFEGHTLNNFMKETPDILFIALGNFYGIIGAVIALDYKANAKKSN